MKHELIDQLKQLFKEHSDRYLVHQKCKPILEQMASSQEFLYDIIRYNLSNAEFFKRDRTYPTLSLSIEENSDFTFVVNIFPALPNQKTDISFQSIHHHGSLLLSTVGAYGVGYKSILFNKGFIIDKQTGETQMSISKEYQNEKGKVEFVDANQPHIVFFPSEISATYAFWCDEKKQAKEVIKKIGFIKKLKKPLVRIINAFGLSKLLGLNNIAYFDFYPENEKLIALKDRLAYTEAGGNDNFIQNIFFFIQQTGFNDAKFLNNLMQSDCIPTTAKLYIYKLLNNEIIEDHFFEGHLNVPKVTLNYQEVLKAVKN